MVNKHLPRRKLHEMGTGRRHPVCICFPQDLFPASQRDVRTIGCLTRHVSNETLIDIMNRDDNADSHANAREVIKKISSSSPQNTDPNQANLPMMSWPMLYCPLTYQMLCAGSTDDAHLNHVLENWCGRHIVSPSSLCQDLCNFPTLMKLAFIKHPFAMANYAENYAEKLFFCPPELEDGLGVLIPQDSSDPPPDDDGEEKQDEDEHNEEDNKEGNEDSPEQTFPLPTQ